MTDAPQQTPARRSTYLRSGAVALAVVVIIGLFINFFALQRHTGSTVDGHQIAEELSQAIQAKTGATKPPQVSCPASLPARDINFNCTWQKGATPVIVAVHRTGNRFTWNPTNAAAAALPS